MRTFPQSSGLSPKGEYVPSPERYLALAVVSSALAAAKRGDLRSLYWLRNPSTAETWLTLADIPVTPIYRECRRIAQQKGLWTWWIQVETDFEDT